MWPSFFDCNWKFPRFEESIDSSRVDYLGRNSIPWTKENDFSIRIYLVAKTIFSQLAGLLMGGLMNHGICRWIKSHCVGPVFNSWRTVYYDENEACTVVLASRRSKVLVIVSGESAPPPFATPFFFFLSWLARCFLGCVASFCSRV